jgi:anti-sigma B factor antagonist
VTLKQEKEPESSRLKLSIEIEEINNTTVLHCSGRICFQREAQLFSRLALNALRAGQDLVLDLMRVASVDSAGIGQLVLIHMQAQAAQCAVRIAAAPRSVYQLLVLTNVASLFETYPAVQDAVASLLREMA